MDHRKDSPVRIERTTEELQEEIQLLARAGLFSLLAESQSFAELEGDDPELFLRRMHIVMAFFKGLPELYKKLTSAAKGKSWTKDESGWAVPTAPNGDRAPALRPVLIAVHPWAYKLISDLLAKKEVKPPFALIPLPSWVLKDGKLQEQWPHLAPEQELLRSLLDLLREKPFPFKRCRNCKKIFSRPPLAKVWMYCSKECANEALLTARRPGRREYMREYRARRGKGEMKEEAKQQVNRS